MSATFWYPWALQMEDPCRRQMAHSFSDLLFQCSYFLHPKMCFVFLILLRLNVRVVKPSAVFVHAVYFTVFPLPYNLTVFYMCSRFKERHDC